MRSSFDRLSHNRLNFDTLSFSPKAKLVRTASLPLGLTFGQNEEGFDPEKKPGFFNRLALGSRCKTGFQTMLNALNPKVGLGQFVKDNLISMGLSLAISFLIPPFGLASLASLPLMLATFPPVILGLNFLHGFFAPRRYFEEPTSPPSS